MNKQEYLDLLRFHLQSLPKNIVDDIVSDYELHFQEGIDLGRSEEEISRDLGSPQKLAQEYLESEDPSQLKNQGFSKKEDKKEKNIPLIILAIIGLLVAGPLIFGLGVGFVGIVFALFMTFVSLFLSAFLVGLVSLISVVINLNGVPWISLGSIGLLHPLSRFFLGLFLISTSLLFAILCFKLLSLAWTSLKNGIKSWRWKMKKKKLEKESL